MSMNRSSGMQTAPFPATRQIVSFSAVLFLSFVRTDRQTDAMNALLSSAWVINTNYET